MPFSAYTVAAVAIPTAAITTYLYNMYMSFAPKPILIIKETTMPSVKDTGFRTYEVILENYSKGAVGYAHPKNACMELHEIHISRPALIESPFEETPSSLKIGDITTPENQNLYEACKVCDPNTMVRYQDRILGDVSFRYPWTAAKFE